MKSPSYIRQHADIKQLKHCKETVSELNESFDYLAYRLSLVGSSIRLKILYLLHEEKRLCVGDLSDILEMNISAISQHLRKMKDRSLIKTEREAQTIFYSLTPEYKSLLIPFFEILDHVRTLEALWQWKQIHACDVKTTQIPIPWDYGEESQAINLPQSEKDTQFCKPQAIGAALDSALFEPRRSVIDSILTYIKST